MGIYIGFNNNLFLCLMKVSFSMEMAFHPFTEMIHIKHTFTKPQPLVGQESVEQ